MTGQPTWPLLRVFLPHCQRPLSAEEASLLPGTPQEPWSKGFLFQPQKTHRKCQLQSGCAFSLSLQIWPPPTPVRHQLAHRQTEQWHFRRGLSVQVLLAMKGKSPSCLVLSGMVMAFAQSWPHGRCSLRLLRRDVLIPSLHQPCHPLAAWVGMSRLILSLCLWAEHGMPAS